MAVFEWRVVESSLNTVAFSKKKSVKGQFALLKGSVFVHLVRQVEVQVSWVDPSRPKETCCRRSFQADV